MAKNEWESIDQVPLLAWYRFKARPNNVYRISEIDLQYCGGAMMPGLAIKAGPAVMIDHQWWRPNELSAVFDVSCDGTEWQSCAGEVGGRGNLTDRVARLEATLVANKGKLSDDVANALKELVQVTATQAASLSAQGQQVAELKEAFDRMANVVDSHSNGMERLLRPEQKLPAGNSEQAKETPKSNPGSKPPEPKK